VYQVRRKPRKSRSGRRYYQYTARRVSKNPKQGFKNALMEGGGVFLGVLGVRALNNYLGNFLVSKIGTSLPASVSKMIPSSVSLVAAAFAGKLIKGKPGVVNKIQLAAGIGFLDAVMANFVAPHLPASLSWMAGNTAVALPASSAGEYLPQMGVDVQEALADYVSDPNRMLTSGGAFGVDVSEALAGDEVVNLKRGYAAGTLAHTVFND